MALGGFKFVSKIIDQFTKLSEINLLKAKFDVVDSLQLYNQHTVIPSGNRLVRVKGDRSGEFTGNVFRQYCREVGVNSYSPLLTRLSKLVQTSGLGEH